MPGSSTACVGPMQVPGRSQTAGEAWRRAGVADRTCCRWRTRHGGLRIDHTARMREFGAGKAPPMNAVAELPVHRIVICKEVTEGGG
jgi:hypothetical protein